MRKRLGFFYSWPRPTRCVWWRSFWPDGFFAYLIENEIRKRCCREERREECVHVKSVRLGYHIYKPVSLSLSLHEDFFIERQSNDDKQARNGGGVGHCGWNALIGLFGFYNIAHSYKLIPLVCQRATLIVFVLSLFFFF